MLHRKRKTLAAAVAFDIAGQPFDEFHTPLRPHHENARIESIRPDPFFCNDRHTLTGSGRLKRFRIKNMMIADPVTFEKSFIVACR